MYTEFIKRSRLYLELKRDFQGKCHQFENETQNVTQSRELMGSVLRQFSSRSLLLTKRQLQQLIRLLHVQNVVIRAVKKPNSAQNCKEAIKREQKQAQQAEHIEKLKFKLQMYQNEVITQNKRINDLKLKIQVCKQYLKQTQTYQEIRKNIHQDKDDFQIIKIEKNNTRQIKSSKSNTKDRKCTQKSIHHQNDQVPMIELIKGFEDLNKNNDSLLQSFNYKDSLYEKRNSPIGVKCVKNGEQSISNEKKPSNLHNDSSSLIDTSSFIANYHVVPKSSVYIKQLLKESQSEIQMEGRRQLENQHNIKRNKQATSARPYFKRVANTLQVFEQVDKKQYNLNSNNESSDQSIDADNQNYSQENQENQENEQEKLSFGMKGFTLQRDQYTKQVDKLKEKQKQIQNEKSMKDSPKLDSKVSFLSVLSRFNSDSSKITQ